MELTWLGHAAFRLRIGNTTVIADPFPQELGLQLPPALSQANVVTISNDGPNHSAAGVVQGDPTVLDGPGEYEVAGLQMRGVRTPFAAAAAEPEAGQPGSASWNTVFIIEAEGMTVCHLGLPSGPLTARQVEEISSPHVLILPVGARSGLSAVDAGELVSAMSPRIVVPMLFEHPGNRADLLSLAPFLQQLGVRPPEPQTRLTVTRAALPEEAQVVLLQPAATLL